MGVHASCVPVRLFGLSRPRGATVSVGVPKPVSIGLPMPAVSGVCVLCGGVWRGMWGSVCMGVDTEALACDPAAAAVLSPLLRSSLLSARLQALAGYKSSPPPPEFFFFPPYPPAEPCAMDCVSGPPRGFAGVAAAHLAADDQTNASCLSSPLPTRPSLYPTAWGGHAKNAGTGHDAARHPPPPSPLP